MSNLIPFEEFNAESKDYYAYRCTSCKDSQTPHYHDYFELGYIISGQACHSQGNDSMVLNPGDVFIIPTGFIHKLKFTAENTELYALAFQESIFPIEFLQSNTLHFLKDLKAHYDTGIIPLSLTPNSEQKNSIETLMKVLIQEQKSSISPELSAAPTLIMSIVCLLAQCYYGNTNNNRQPWNQADNVQLLRRCIAYVDTHFTEHLTPDTLAKQFGFSRSSLCSALQQRTGLPLHKYISTKRIHRAQMLIRTNPETPLSQIAGQVGYEDDSTFYRNFLKIAGVSPSSFRDLCREQNQD